MNANRIKIVKNDINKFVNIPVNMQWDFMGRDDSISEYETKAIKEVTGIAADFEVARFSNNIFQNFNTDINYEFNFYDDTAPITANTIGNWSSTYLNEGFSVQDIYYFSKPFTKSFFKLDFYDTTDLKTQKNYFTIILPVQQGFFELASISQLLPNVNIRKPKFRLDYIGDKEGFYIYWLRKREYIDINKFFMSAKFFDAKLGVYVKMTNIPQPSIPNPFTFNGNDYFYYQVNLDYTTKTYEAYATSNLVQRVGTDNLPIKWYEYVNPE